MISKIKEIKKKEIPSVETRHLCYQKSSCRNCEPVFLKLQAELAKAMMNINAAKVLNMEAVFVEQTMTGKRSI